MQNYITLEEIDIVKIFKGTEEERKAEEAKEESNARDLFLMYNLVKGGKLPCIFTRSARHPDGTRSIYALHGSAKYGDDLQYTAFVTNGGEFLYMTYDCRIDGFRKFEREFAHGEGERVYFENWEEAAG